MSEVNFRLYYSNCVWICDRRILCLTDGYDNKSKTTAFEVATLLRVIHGLICAIINSFNIIVKGHHC